MPRARNCSTWRRSVPASLSVSVSTNVYPALLSTCSAPRTIGGNSGLVTSGTTMATTYERAVRRPRASALGT